VGALNLGSDRDPAWCLNLRSNPDAAIEVNGELKAVRAREAADEEAEQLWQGFIERLPATANSRAVARRDVPMFVLDPIAHESRVATQRLVARKGRHACRPFVQTGGPRSAVGADSRR
jgi:hypothetical protein